MYSETKNQTLGMRRFSVLLLACAGFFLLGCEKEEDRNIYDAQNCLDRATSTTVSACVAKVAGIESEQAYMIRCSAHYITNGFTTARFADAFQKIKDNPSGGTNNGMVTAMAYLMFPSTTGANGSDIAQSDCQKSGSRGLYRLAIMTSMATVVGVAGGFTPGTSGITEAEMRTAITNLSGANVTTVGTIAITAAEQYCNAGSAFATNDVCKTLNQAVTSGADAATIGAQLQAALLANP